MHLKIITPRKIVIDEDIKSVTMPSAEGEITVLPHHSRLLSVLNEGIITIRNEKEEHHLAIGGGYVETDGTDVTVLVSRAYNQTEIDEQLTLKAMEEAKKMLKEVKDVTQRLEAAALLRRSIIDIKLIKRHKKKVS
ncbi:ATP synthase F1 subunit epsilon [Candidatus Roizmanbacteria bacterium]|nr:ATP synthase F1 subunit epsilon [Candidatus Roizmanbacteria bacterium]